MRRKREEWRRLVARWARSGLAAGAFAAEAGVNAKTLQYWKYALARERQSSSEAALAEIVEVRSSGGADERFEVEVAGGRRLRVPRSFDGEALRRLLAVLEATS